MKIREKEKKRHVRARYLAVCIMAAALMFNAAGCGQSSGVRKVEANVIESEVQTDEQAAVSPDPAGETGNSSTGGSVTYVTNYDNSTTENHSEEQNNHNEVHNNFNITPDDGSGDDDILDDEVWDDGYADDEYEGDDSLDDEHEGDDSFDDEYADDGSEGDDSFDDGGDYDTVDSDRDYSAGAQVRTNEVSFNVHHSRVGATEAVLRADFTNFRSSPATIVGCSVYDWSGKLVGKCYTSENLAPGSSSLEYDLGSDMGLVLERGETYYYRFAVMVDGELFTHDRYSFMTNEVDDTFAIEYLDPQIDAYNVQTGIKVYNPTGAHVTKAGIKVTYPTGAFVADEVQAIDESGSEFTVYFNLNDSGERLDSDQKFTYIIYIEYNGKVYDTNWEEFTTLV